MDLSVVIVNWNTRDELNRCLTSLRPALAAWRSEVLVVDNASSDGSAAMVRQEHPWVELLANSQNLNYAAGSNQALSRATGARVLLLNPDTVVSADALHLLVKTLDENPQAGAVAPALVFPSGELQSSVRSFPSPAVLLSELTWLNRLLPTLPRYRQKPPQDRVSEVDQPMTSALLIQREALDQVGCFDEEFPLYFNDVDWCYRCRKAGWTILYQPAARIQHDLGASTRQVKAAAIRLSHDGLSRFYTRHYLERMGAMPLALMLLVIRLSGVLRAALASIGSERKSEAGDG